MGPVELLSLKPLLLSQLEQGPVVLSAPTGTGKSTAVPRWLAGRVLVVEPRRLACQALAQRVAELEGEPVGQQVGYRVRDDDRTGPHTRLVYATPGIVLQDRKWLSHFDHIVIDEFHERRIDTDWLCAWLVSQQRPFLVMSATVDGDRIAKAIGGEHLSAAARAFEVTVDYIGSQSRMPEADGLAPLFRDALAQAAGGEGDVLVFLPGKKEIEQFAQLGGDSGLELYQLHGGMSLREQARAFQSSAGRKLILATNVAETSITLAGVRWVIDTGMVRRTHYHGGRSYLALSPIARDSAEQRRGRAGRTAPGRCLRLWGRAASLAEATPPEISRESLAPMVLWSSAWGAAPESLPFLDPPAPHALAAAREELAALGAFDADGTLSATGDQLQSLPLEPFYARVLVEARSAGVLSQMIELVALLSAQPPVRLPPADEQSLACDAADLMLWLHAGDERSPGRTEVKRSIGRLRRAFGLSDASDLGRSRQEVAEVTRALIRCVVRADARSVHIARSHKRELTWAAGGTELALARDTRIQGAAMPEALVVLATHAQGRGRDRRLLITRASPIPLTWLKEEGLGEERVQSPSLEKGVLSARVERVYAGRTIATEMREVTGVAARTAVGQLLCRGSLFRAAVAEARTRLERRRLLAHLAASARGRSLGLPAHAEPPELAAFFDERLSVLGLESGADLQLLAPEDLLPDAVPAECRAILDSEFPMNVDAGGCTYRVQYDLPNRQVLLCVVRGHRTTAPSMDFLPSFRGFRVCAEVAGSLRTLRERG